MLKIGLCAYGFNQNIADDITSFLDFIPLAREIGYELIDFPELPAFTDIEQEEIAQIIADRCKECDIEVGHYSPNIDFIFGSGGDPHGNIERMKHHIDIAEILGASGVTFNGVMKLANYYNKSGEDIISLITMPIYEIAKYGYEAGIITMTENVGRIIQDSKIIESLVRKVAHSNFGVCVNIGNSICIDKDPVMEMRNMMPYCKHLHIKDFLFKPGNATDPGQGWGRTKHGNYIRGTVLGHGVVNIEQAIWTLRDLNYKGTICVQFGGYEDLRFALDACYKNLKRLCDKYYGN